MLSLQEKSYSNGNLLNGTIFIGVHKKSVEEPYPSYKNRAKTDGAMVGSLAPDFPTNRKLCQIFIDVGLIVQFTNIQFSLKIGSK